MEYYWDDNKCTKRKTVNIYISEENLSLSSRDT